MRISHKMNRCGLWHYNESSLTWIVLKDLLGGDVQRNVLVRKYVTSQSSDFDRNIECLIQNDILYQHNDLYISFHSALVNTVMRRTIRGQSRLHRANT